MSKIVFPEQIDKALRSGPGTLYAPVRALADSVEIILADNKLAFFPAYTDHGVDHINAVLRSQCSLVPKDVWARTTAELNGKLFSDKDAAILIAASLFHDIGMHLTPKGFLELVSERSRFRPIPWFDVAHEDHYPDKAWHELWNDYVSEVHRMSERKLGDILSEEVVRSGWKFTALPGSAFAWDSNHHLIIGEFIRRHHARLAHEVAIYGFPGLEPGTGDGQFPSLADSKHPLCKLADLIGLTARSHGTSLRVCLDYIEHHPKYRDNPLPMGSAVLYPMALLRIADYLQIDRERAPAILLQLREPQSPISVQEWSKHHAVQSIGPAKNPRGITVTVSQSVDYRTFLQLEHLIEGLQQELDHSTAVLDEVYGSRADIGLNELTLTIRRVYSNITIPAFRADLPFVAEPIRFTSDPNLLSLLVEPLYGHRPSIGVRELLQNSIDAVRELRVWNEKRHTTNDLPPSSSNNADILIEIIEQDVGPPTLRIQDRGIGMSLETIRDYFLRAGASFRHSSAWESEFQDSSGRSKVLRSGRFGVGVFSIFLLGRKFKLLTRHVGADESEGLSLEASSSSQLIEIRRLSGLPFGTSIEVELAEKLPRLQDLDWYCLDWPVVEMQKIQHGRMESLKQRYAASLGGNELGPEWSRINVSGYDSVFWTFGDFPELACNGIIIGSEPNTPSAPATYLWRSVMGLKKPRVSVLDSSASLPLTIQRDSLANLTLPFASEISRDILLSFIAHSLVTGPVSCSEAMHGSKVHPLVPEAISSFDSDSSSEDGFCHGRFRWCATSTHAVPIDPWCAQLLGVTEFCVAGAFDTDNVSSWAKESIATSLSTHVSSDTGVFHWHSLLNLQEHEEYLWRTVDTSRFFEDMLSELPQYGIEALSKNTDSSCFILKLKTEHGIPGFTLFDDFEKLGSAINAGEFYFTAHGGTSRKARLPYTLMRSMNGTLQAEHEQRNSGRVFFSEPDILFAGKVILNQVDVEPKSLLAKTWNEFLGRRAIPFEMSARRGLIDELRGRSEIGYHIKAWEAMSKQGSRWLNSNQS